MVFLYNNTLVKRRAIVLIYSMIQPIIYGGHETSASFVVSMHLSLTKSRYCGGTLIAPRFVLTAAHCPKPNYIRFGKRKFVKAESITTHPLYKNVRGGNDFAIVKLAEPVLDIKPVLLSLRKEEMYSETATTMGWGRIDPIKQSNVLKEEDFQLISTDVCRVKDYDATRRSMSKYQRKRFQSHLPDSVLCALSTKQGNSVCFGDSGGPLVRNKDADRPLLIGVTSWVIECGLKDAPMGFARVSFARDFIDQHSKGHAWFNDGETPKSIAPYPPQISILILLLLVLKNLITT